jgi:hypothetical protein
MLSQKEKFTELCQRAESETDRNKFIEIIQELNRLFDEEEVIRKQPQRPNGSTTAAA